MDIKILENLLLETIDRGNLINRHHQVIQKRIMVNLGLLKSGKVVLRSTIDLGNLKQFLGIHCQKLPLIVRNLFLARNAHSARYGETIDDGSGKFETVKHQEGAESETFVKGSDAPEIVNKVKDQVRSRQNVERCRFR